MSTTLCQYSKTCSIFQGQEKTCNTPLTLFKNVFCQRGYKGWNNCDRYLKLSEASNDHPK